MTEENQPAEPTTTAVQDSAMLPAESTATDLSTTDETVSSVEAVAGNPTQPVADAPAAATDAPPAPSGAPTASAATTPEAAPEGELHRLLSNGLHIFGKSEHWTAQEIAAFAAWLESRL